MSLTSSYSAFYPCLHHTDRVALHDDFAIKGYALVDQPIYAQHQLSYAAAKLLRLLAGGLRFDQFLALARQLGIKNDDICHLLGFLNNAGGLRVRRSMYARAVIGIKRWSHYFLGVRYDNLVRRWPPTATGLLRAVMHATLAVFLSGCAVAILVTCTGLHGISTTLAAFTFSYSLFLASLVLHEFGHWLGLRKHGVPSVITSTSLRIGVIHPQLKPSEELAVAIRGPLWGIVAPIVAISGSVITSQPLLALISCVICCVHLGGFLPWYGDGKTIQQSLRNTSQ